MLNSLFSDPISLGIAQASITMLLALGVMLVARKESLHIEKEVMVALVRGVVQITAVGSVLLVLLKSPAWTSLIILSLMFVVAAMTAAKRARGIKGAFEASFYGIAIAATAVIGSMSLVGVIEFSILSMVPVGSMVIAAAMNSNALTLNRFRAEVESHLGLIETALALGASPKTAVKPYIRAAIHAGMIPRIDSLKTLGIVWIPGLMTGMILAGADPIYAAIYQFVVMGMIFAVSGLSAMITMKVVQKKVFSPAEQLLMYREEKNPKN